MMKRAMIGLCSVLLLVSAGVSPAAQDKPVAKDAKPPAHSVKLIPAVVQPPQVFPVVFADVEIFAVSTSPVGSLTPGNRARLIQQNIQAFADSDADSMELKVIETPDGSGIGDTDNMLMVVTRRDAENTGKTTAVLANEILGRIQTAVEAYRTRHTWETYGLAAAYSVLAIIGLWLALYGNRWLFSWLMKKASALHDHWKGGIHFKQLELLSAHRIEKMVLFTLKLFRMFVVLLCLYFFLPLILSFFPGTHKLSTRILEYLLTPFVTIFHTLVKYIPNLFFIFVIGVITYYILKVISYVFRLIERGELTFDWFYQDWARPTYQIIRFLVIVVALISAYPYIPGSSSQAFQGVGLVLGAIISFASSSAISNIIAGIILTYTRAFKLNDRVKIGETSGDVAEKTLLVTRINTIKQEIVTIPNSLVMSSQIINYSTSVEEGDGVVLHTSVTIGYDVPWTQVKALLTEAAKDTKNILEEPEPYVLQTALNDFYVSYEINAYTKEPKYMAFTYSDLHRNIQEKFDAAGVEIMSPHYYALRDGNAAAVPSVLAGKGYKAPPFRVDIGRGELTAD